MSHLGRLCHEEVLYHKKLQASPRPFSDDRDREEFDDGILSNRIKGRYLPALAFSRDPFSCRWSIGERFPCRWLPGQLHFSRSMRMPEDSFPRCPVIRARLEAAMATSFWRLKRRARPEPDQDHRRSSPGQRLWPLFLTSFLVSTERISRLVSKSTSLRVSIPSVLFCDEPVVLEALLQDRLDHPVKKRDFHPGFLEKKDGQEERGARSGCAGSGRYQCFQARSIVPGFYGSPNGSHS